MTWNYRVVVKEWEGYPYFAIHEVYYNEAEEVTQISYDSTSAFGETLDELVKDYARMAEAFKKPIIDFNTMKEI